jgi:hypothetical protein
MQKLSEKGGQKMQDIRKKKRNSLMTVFPFKHKEEIVGIGAM